MSSEIHMGGPVCLILNTQDGQVQVNPEALEILSRITQPVVVVAIVGLYRTGKSYLMNKLAGVTRGFDLGSTIEAKTKGIWMWCVPHPTKMNHTLVLLDTEGLGDVKKGDKKNDLKIFSLAVLLSSALVYNSMGTIDQDAIEKLHYVSELSDLIKVKSSDDDDDEAEFSRHFPIFIWTVRDFSLKLEKNGSPIMEDDYLESALELKEPEETNADRDFNFPKKCVRMYFGNRKCFVFDRPGDENILQNIEKVPDYKLKPEFVAQAKMFCDYVFNNAGVKHMDMTQEVTGTILGNLATMYTDTMKRGDVTCLETAAQTLSEIENEKAVQEASQYYENMMKERLVFPTNTMEQFMDVSGECEKEALEIFMRRSFKDNEQKFQKKLMGIVHQKKCDFSKQNETASYNYCKALIAKYSEDLEKAIKDGSFAIHGGYQKFSETMEKIVENYNNDPKKGIQAEDVLQEFQKSKEIIGKTILMTDSLLNDKEKEMEEEKRKAKAKELELKVLEEKNSQEKQKTGDQERTLQEHLTQLINKMEQDRNRMNDEIERIIGEKRREYEAYDKQGCRSQANMYQAQIDDLEKNKTEVNKNSWLGKVWDFTKDITVLIAPAVLSKCGGYLKNLIKRFK